MMNPEYSAIAAAYGIPYRRVEEREELASAVEEMFLSEGPFLLDVHVEESFNVFPMIPPGKSVNQIMLNETDWI